MKFSEPRRRRERRIYTAAAILFAGFMLVARPLGSLESGDIDWPVGPDSIVTWLLAVIAMVLVVFVDARRLLVYAAILAATGAIAFLVEQRLGAPLLVSGAVILLVGLVLYRRFVGRHPQVEAR